MSAYETGLSPQVEERIRAIARDELASLAGKALRRSQDASLTRNPVHNEAEAAANRVQAHFWGEVLAEYGQEGFGRSNPELEPDSPR